MRQLPARKHHLFRRHGARSVRPEESRTPCDATAARSPASCVDQGVKAIVVACNTATAHALADAARGARPARDRRRRAGRARRGRARRARGHIGVIGTAGTIKSGAYERAIRASAPDATITARACPLFVPLVEEGWLDHDATRLVAREYLEPLRRGERRYARARLHALSAAQAAARATCSDPTCVSSTAPRKPPPKRRALWRRAQSRRRRATADPTYRFIASDDPLQFLQLGQRFLGGTIEGVEIRTLG